MLFISHKGCILFFFIFLYNFLLFSICLYPFVMILTSLLNNVIHYLLTDLGSIFYSTRVHLVILGCFLLYMWKDIRLTCPRWYTPDIRSSPPSKTTNFPGCISVSVIIWKEWVDKLLITASEMIFKMSNWQFYCKYLFLVNQTFALFSFSNFVAI